jgi:type II secretory pathway pseudopilin PulG
MNQLRNDVKLHSKQRGMLYIAVLLFVAVTSLIGLKVTQAIALQVQRDVELDLLQAGREIRKAIGDYYESSPGSIKVYPASLEALLQDERFLGIRRHLRKIHADPVTKKADWLLIKAVQGGIQGVASTSTKTPVRKTQFLGGEAGFDTALSYQDWKFVYIPTLSGTRPATISGSSNLNSNPQNIDNSPNSSRSTNAPKR